MRRLLIASLVLAAGLSIADAEAPLLQPGSIQWSDDILRGFWKHTIDLGRDYDGPITATLVRRPLQRRDRECAVLYVHGYVDYFLQPHLADYYDGAPAPVTRQGCDFFALDLRKYGRSMSPNEPHRNFAKSLDEYFDEITWALEQIEREGYTFVLLNGHSTGALTVVRYMQSGKRHDIVDAVFLNSPFLDFNDRDLKWYGVGIANLIGWLKPFHEQTSTVPLWYARSLLRPDLCRDCHGRWEFKLEFKPIEGFPVFLGWVRAIAKAQDQARKGGITKPILILHSARSNDGTDSIWHEEYRRADLVLDVEDMTREGPKLGTKVTIKPIEGGVHDLSLSDPDALARVFDAVSAWLRTVR